MIIFSNPFIVFPLDNKEKIWGWKGIPKLYFKKKPSQGICRRWCCMRHIIYFKRTKKVKNRHPLGESSGLSSQNQKEENAKLHCLKPSTSKWLIKFLYNSDHSFEIYQLKFFQLSNEMNIQFVPCTMNLFPLPSTSLF